MKPACTSVLVAMALGATPSLQSAQAQTSPPLLAQMMHGEKGTPTQGTHPAPGHTMPGTGGQQGTGSSGMHGMMCGPGMQMPMMQGGSMMQMPMMRQGRMIDMPSDYVEGRIAFIHAELRITDSQTAAWTEFANVLRASAKRSAEDRGAHGQQTAPTSAARLEEQERWLAARLEGVRALKAAYGKLYAVLDDRQKKTADELMAMPMGNR